ncbi:MAG: tRNA-Thr(GGU) m(6)t(6)A37 methyltransferase TsaA [Halobacteriales archaeon]|jgi:tRNA-Thr(GGU) m(6)t(6)A37 methyltransferase TsaA
MDEDDLRYESIGVIRSPFESVGGMPIQASAAGDAVGTVELDDRYGPGLADLDEFSHCILLYHFHRADDGASLSIRPFLDDDDRGLFSTRAPRRPNPIGLSVVAIEDVDDGTLTVRGVDVLDGTPLLDIKPYVPDFDVREDAEAGWLDATPKRPDDVTADDRFR